MRFALDLLPKLTLDPARPVEWELRRTPSAKLLSGPGAAKSAARFHYESGAQQPPKGSLRLIMVQHRAVDVVDEAEDPAEFGPVRIRIANWVCQNASLAQREGRSRVFSNTSRVRRRYAASADSVLLGGRQGTRTARSEHSRHASADPKTPATR